MSSYSVKDEREYFWFPFGMFKGTAFPDMPRDFLQDCMKPQHKDLDRDYPGLRQSISEFLNGGGWHGRQQRQRAQEKQKARQFWEDFTEQSNRAGDWFREGWQQRPQAHTIVADKAKAKEIIDAGRRRMAQKHHPDNGGSEDAMKAYNAAADWLETLL